MVTTPRMRADALRNEAEWLPSRLGDLVDVRRRVIAAGYGAATANGLIGWLVSKAAGERDITGAPTRSRYRKILAELDVDHDPGRGRHLEVVAEAPGQRDGREISTAAQNPRCHRFVKLAAA